jgi:type I restriction enzyme R subunit
LFTDGRIFAFGGVVHKCPRKIVDYVLRYTRNFSSAIVEAKVEDVPAGEGMQEAKECADILGLKFAYVHVGL